MINTGVQQTANIGLYVTHLMVSLPSGGDRQGSGNSLIKLVDKYRSTDFQIISSSVFGFECDVMLMCLAKNVDTIWQFEQDVKKIDLIISDSFFSITELSEYTTTEAEEQERVNSLDETDDAKAEMMKQWSERMAIYEKHRLFPELPEKKFICFYPMSKKREAHANWYALSFDERVKYMRNHGSVGRKYSGKILQLITGATGLTDFEWGVTLLSDSLVDIKNIVYEMRFDEASALYGEFGHFTIAKIVSLEEALS